MRALPQIDIQPAPVQADAPARATGRESGNFAETLQRSTDAKSTKNAKGPSSEHDAERPRDLAEKVEQAEKPTSEKPADVENAPPKKPVTDDSAATNDDVLPDNDGVIVAPEIAALLATPQLPIIAQPNTATATLTDFDPLAAIAAPADDAALKSLGTAPNATPIVGPAVQATVAPVITAATGPQVTAAAANAPKTNAPPAANAALAAAPTTDLAPTADITLVASSTPVVPVTAPQSNTKAGDASLPVAAAVTTATTEVDPSSALPPVVAGDNAAPTTLPLSTAAPATAPTDDAAAMAAPLPSATPITTATPATQSVGMHAVAAAIGEHDSKSVTATDSSTAPAKSTNDLAMPAAPQQPSTPVTPTRPMSETVLAQNTLAEQGNAMEKAVSHQVSKALVQHLPNGDRMMVLRLTPPELGTVKIELIERQGVFSARLHAEDDGVRLALERFLPSMRQDLRASDAPIRELNLSDQAQFQRSFADGQQGQQQNANRSGNRRQRDDAPRFSIDGVRSDPVVAPRAAPLGGRVSLSEVDALA